MSQACLSERHPIPQVCWQPHTGWCHPQTCWGCSQSHCGSHQGGELVHTKPSGTPPITDLHPHVDHHFWVQSHSQFLTIKQCICQTHIFPISREGCYGDRVKHLTTVQTDYIQWLFPFPQKQLHHHKKAHGWSGRTCHWWNCACL